MKDMNARPTTLRSFPQGGLFVTLGVLSLLGNLFAQAPALAGVSVSLAMAGVVGWRGYAQRDPLNEYKSEAFELFNGLVASLREQVTGQLSRIEIMYQQPEGEEGAPDGLGAPPSLPPMFAQHLDPVTGENEMDHAGFGSGSDPADIISTEVTIEVLRP